MRNCIGCKYAHWHTTKNGRLHPSGDGECKKEVREPQLPNAFYVINARNLGGGLINRKKEYDDHCPYYQE